jgi:hypothetical protein
MTYCPISTRKLIALAALAACSTAFADTGYTLFGTIDLGAGATTRDVNIGTANGHTVTSQAGGVVSSNYTSALGVRGTIDIPGGLVAGGVIAWGVNPSNVSNNGSVQGTNNGSPFGQVREGNIYLGGTWGKVVVGSQVTPTFAYGSSAAALQDASIGGSFQATVNSAAVPRGALAMLNTAAVHSANTQASGPYLSPLDGVTGIQPRYENALTYATPNFDGLTGAATYIGTDSGATSTGSATGANSSSNLNGLLLRADYDKAPWSVHVARLDLTHEATTAKRQVTNNFINASYDFGRAVVWGTYAAGANDNKVGAGSVTTKMTEVGVRMPFGQWTPYAYVGNGTLDNSAAFTSSAAGGSIAYGVGSVNASAYQVGVKYALVKGATLWAGYGQSKFENAANGDSDTINGFRVGGTFSF